MRKTLALVSVVAVSMIATAAVEYTYENDGKTYVATVTSAETAISDEAIAVLNANEVTNFVIKGSQRLVVDKSSTFTGDVHVTSPVRIVAEKSLGIGPGKIYVTLKRITMSGGTVEKDVFFDCGTTWNESTGIGAWGGYGTSTFKGKVSYSDRTLNVYPWANSTIVFEGGLEGTGGMYIREAEGGTVVFTNSPLLTTYNYPLSFIYSDNLKVDSSGFLVHMVFTEAGNRLARFGHASYRFTKGDLRTTVDWAFDNAGMAMHFNHSSKWDLCGTSQRIGYLDFTCTSGNPSVVTNSLEAPATLYITQTANATPAAVFGGNLSVDFSGNKITTIDYSNTAKGGITVNAGTLAFTENGSWNNATDVTVNGSAKITIAKSGVFHRAANMSLATVASLDLASGVAMRVASLKIGGAEMPYGDYQFGSGTLSVGPVSMRIIVR